MLFKSKPKKDDHIVTELIKNIHKMSCTNKISSSIAFYIDGLLISISNGLYNNVEVNKVTLSVSRKKRIEFFNAATSQHDGTSITELNKKKNQIYNTLNIDPNEKRLQRTTKSRGQPTSVTTIRND